MSCEKIWYAVGIPKFSIMLSMEFHGDLKFFLTKHVFLEPMLEQVSDLLVPVEEIVTLQLIKNILYHCVLQTLCQQFNQVSTTF